MATVHITPSAESSAKTRAAVDWAGKCERGALSASELDQWFSLYPQLLEGANAQEFDLLMATDCAVEANITHAH